MTELAAPSVFSDFFDGQSAVPHRAEISLDGDAIVIAPPETEPIRWSLDSLRGIPDQATVKELVVTSADMPLARLYIAHAGARAALQGRARNLGKRPPVRGKGRVAAWAAAAVASVALIVFALVPLMADQLAEYLPPEGEKALGDATLDQIRSALDESGLGELPFCENPAGLSALRAMEDRLTVGLDLPYPVRVSVLDHGMINAFALPGGHVVFFRGLIDAAEDPDEVAAVLAHEMGHVIARDPARIALRSAGSVGVLGLLLGDFAGGAAVLFIVEWLIQADYTREAEAAADAFAHETLRRANLPPDALASMFRRLRDEYGDGEGIVSHFLSHPSLGDRIAQAEAAAEGQGDTMPSLDASRWRALRRICD